MNISSSHDYVYNQTDKYMVEANFFYARKDGSDAQPSRVSSCTNTRWFRSIADAKAFFTYYNQVEGEWCYVSTIIKEHKPKVMVLSYENILGEIHSVHFTNMELLENSVIGLIGSQTPFTVQEKQ